MTNQNTATQDKPTKPYAYVYGGDQKYTIKTKPQEKKFELTNESMPFHGVTVHRIRALRTFGNVTRGDLGGWVEKEANLSQYGKEYPSPFGGDRVHVYDDTAWIGGEAVVLGNARVHECAQVYHTAIVYGNANIYGYARVHGAATVFDYACVGGNAVVFHDSHVYGNAHVMGNAAVFGEAHVFDYARLCGASWVFYNAWVHGGACLFDNSKVGCNARVSGTTKLYGKVEVLGHKRLSKGNYTRIGVWPWLCAVTCDPLVWQGITLGGLVALFYQVVIVTGCALAFGN